MRLVTNHASNTFLALRAAGRRLGCEVRALSDFESEEELAKWDPVGALVFMYGWPLAAEKAVDLLRGLGVPVATWQVDDPHYLKSRELAAVTTRIARRSSLYFSHTLELAEDYADLGVRVVYLPTGARELPGTEELVGPPPDEKDFELDYSFVCTLSERRRAWFEALRDRLPGRRGELVTGVTQEDAFRVYRLTRVNLFSGAYSQSGVADSWGLSERTWEVPLVGGFLLQEERRHLRDHFTPGEDAETFANLDECAAKIERYCQDPEARRRIALRAHELVLAKHRMDHRLSVVLEELGRGS